VGGSADERRRTDDVTRDRERQVVLTKVKYIGACGQRDVGPVVSALSLTASKAP
jgi:hypothetical protein